MLDDLTAAGADLATPDPSDDTVLRAALVPDRAAEVEVDRGSGPQLATV